VTVPVPTGVTGAAVDMRHADETFGVVGFADRSVAPAVALPLVVASDDELRLVSRLEAAITSRRFDLELLDSYYRGTVRIRDLGISIPPQMRQLHTALGWPRVCVDALDERLDVEGFRFPDSTDVDTDLQDVWQANNLDSESQLAHMDALIFGAGFAAVGSNDDGSPLITVESPLDLAVLWDARSRTVRAALRLYGHVGARQATLYLPDQTVSLEQSAAGWSVTSRDVHKLGAVPIVRIANRPRSYDRDGASEITPEIMSITDAACRTLQGLEVAREFYSAPQRYILGADESAFQDAAGNKKSGWETYIGRVLALERDADGNLPSVGQFTPYDPSTFTKVIDMYAKIISSITGLPPHVLGYTTDNPASADAIRSTEMRLKLKADRKCRMFGDAWSDVMRLALLVRDGALPGNAGAITTVWADTATPTPAATTDAIFKQVQMGYLPAESDVTGEKLGYSAVERQRIEVDRKVDAGRSVLAELATSLTAREARVDKSIATTINPAAAKPPTTGTTSDGAAGNGGQ
jgi:hypothetical protein